MNADSVITLPEFLAPNDVLMYKGTMFCWQKTHVNIYAMHFNLMSDKEHIYVLYQEKEKLLRINRLYFKADTLSAAEILVANMVDTMEIDIPPLFDLKNAPQ